MLYPIPLMSNPKLQRCSQPYIKCNTYPCALNNLHVGSVHQGQLPTQRRTPTNLETPRDDPSSQTIILDRLSLFERLGMPFPVKSHQVVHVSLHGCLCHVLGYTRRRWSTVSRVLDRPRQDLLSANGSTGSRIDLLHHVRHVGIVIRIDIRRTDRSGRSVLGVLSVE